LPATALANKPVAILGAGSLGRLWAGYLPPKQACFISRNNPALETTSSEYIHYQLHSPEGQISDCSVASGGVRQFDPALIIVTTKAGDTLQALEPVLPALNASVPVVLFQNGMGLQNLVAKRWPERPVLAASTTEGANRPDEKILVHAGRGQTWVGGLTPAGQQAVDVTIGQLSAAGLALLAEPDIHQRLWNKLVVNAGINAFTTVLDCPNGEILSHPFYLEHIDTLSREIAVVMASDAAEPMPENVIKARIEEVACSTANNTSSMRSDAQRGRKTEIDFINGYIVERGKNAGIATPVNQMLVRRVKELTEPT